MTASDPQGQRRAPTNYWDYIRVEDLLSLQSGLDASDAQVSDIASRLDPVPIGFEFFVGIHLIGVIFYQFIHHS